MWLRPVPAAAQESGIGTPESTNYLKIQSSVELPLVSGSRFVLDSPFELHDLGASGVAGEAGTPDGSFALQVEHKRLSGSLSFLYSPPPRDYLSTSDSPITDGWQNSMVGELSIDVSHGGSTAIKVSTDVELYGMDQQAYDRKQASAQDLTFDWGLEKQFSVSKIPTHSIGLEIGGYHEWVITQSLVAGGPLVARDAGYTIFSTGLQAAFMLPEKNVTLSFRYGMEHLMQAEQKHRSLAIELSWSW